MRKVVFKPLSAALRSRFSNSQRMGVERNLRIERAQRPAVTAEKQHGYAFTQHAHGRTLPGIASMMIAMPATRTRNLS